MKAFDCTPLRQVRCAAVYQCGAVARVFKIGLAVISANAAVVTGQSVSIVSANPPPDNPFLPGQQPFRDVLQDLSSVPSGSVPQGIGALGTPDAGPIHYATIIVTFDGTPAPTPQPANITVECTGATSPPCPTVTAVNGDGQGPYELTLSGPIPPGQCTTLTFAGSAPGKKLQYQHLPGDLSLSGATSAADILALISAVGYGNANLPENLARYDVNRSGVVVMPGDLLRLVALFNGINTTQPWLGKTVAACP